MRTPPTTLQQPETTETIRLTIPVSREVHDTFKRLANASGSSVGRSMGDWLGDTLEAAQFMAVTLEKARKAPKLVMQEMHAYALGLTDETGELLTRVREMGRQVQEAEPDSRAPARRAAKRAAPAGGTTPPSNTGVTSKTTKPSRGQP